MSWWWTPPVHEITIWEVSLVTGLAALLLLAATWGGDR